MPLETLPCQLSCLWQKGHGWVSIISVSHSPPNRLLTSVPGQQRPGFSWIFRAGHWLSVIDSDRFGMLLLFLLYFLTGVQSLLQSLALQESPQLHARTCAQSFICQQLSLALGHPVPLSISFGWTPITHSTPPQQYWELDSKTPMDFFLKMVKLAALPL